MFCPECGYNINENDSFCFACGSMLKKNVGDGRYTIVKILGKGGMGQVLLAHDNKMETDIVLKQLIPPKDDDGLKSEYLEKKMQEEAKLLYRLNYNGLPKVMDCFSENGNFFLVMQYIEGKDLSQVLSEQKEGKIELPLCIRWMDRLLDILGFLHNHDPPIIHRDIKPQNIMIDKTGILYLVDFGIATQMGIKREYTRIGTCDYASPENFTGNYDITSDIYSLGATFYRLITGLAPGDRVHPESFPSIRKYVPDCPDKFQQIFDRMTAFNKQDRFKNCLEIRRELRSDPTLASFLAEEDLTFNIQKTGEQVSAEENESKTVSPKGEAIPEAATEQTVEKPITAEKSEATDKPKIPGESETTEKPGTPQKPETVNIDTGRTEKESPPSRQEVSHSDKHLNLVIFILLIAFLSALFAAIHFEIPRLINLHKGKTYTIIASTHKMDNISRSKKLAEARKLKYRVLRKIDYEVKDKKYRVLACFDSRPAAMIAYKYWADKGYKVTLGEKPDLGIYLDADENYSGREEAEKEASDLNKELDGQYVTAMEIPEKFPMVSFEFIIPGLISKNASDTLKNEFKEFAERVEVTGANDQEGKADEN